MTTKQRKAQFTVKETEDTITRGSQAFSDQFRDRLSYDRTKVLTMAINAWRTNPIARRVIELTTEFTIGDGVGWTCEQSHAKRFIEQFWDDPLNAIDQQIPEWADEAWRSGDLFLLCSVDETGMTFVRAIPSEQIVEIVTAPNDYRQEIAYKRNQIDDKPYEAYDDQEEQTSFVLHFPLNRMVGAAFGESDLSSILYWISLYKQFLEDRARVNHFRQLFSFVVTRPFKSQPEKDTYAAEFAARMPKKSGGIITLDPEEVIGTLNPNLASFEAGEDGLAIKRMIATGAGIPLHYLAEPESSTRTTAESAGTPTFKRFKRRQVYIQNVLKGLLQTVLQVRRRSDSQIPAKPVIDLAMADITERDNSNLAISVQRIVSAFAPLYNSKLIDSKELLRLAYRFVAEIPPKDIPDTFIPVNVRGGPAKTQDKEPTTPKEDQDTSTGE